MHLRQNYYDGTYGSVITSSAVVDQSFNVSPCVGINGIFKSCNISDVENLYMRHDTSMYGIVASSIGACAL